MGDRKKYIFSAISELESEGVEILKRSSIYETEPEDFENQPWFLNMCIKVKTNKTPPEIFETIKKIENKLGRKRTIKKGPRTIDIDIILWSGGIFRSENLKIPHPAYKIRKFVLIPLFEIERDLIDPETGESLETIVNNLNSDKKIIKV